MKKLVTFILSLAIAVSVSAKNRAQNPVQPSAVGHAFEQGKISADSLVNLALYHKAVNPELSESLLLSAAKSGSTRAATELGVLYAFSPKFQKKADEGVKLLESAASAGNKEASGYLGYYYYTKKDYDKAAQYLEAARPFTLGIEYAALGSMYL